MKITLQLPKGEKVYTAPEWDEITIVEFRALLNALAVSEQQAVSTYTGIPMKYVNKMNMAQVDEITTAIAEVCAKAAVGSAEFQEALVKDDGFIPDVSATFGGKTYTVPYDLEMETVWGQWVDWEGWEPPATEADYLAQSIAFMLVEEGKQYEGTPKYKIAEMDACPMSIAFRLSAFFFGKSKRYQSAINRLNRAFRTSMRLQVAKALNLSPDATEAFIASLERQS